ncbi:MAG: hypothetical protein GH143_04530 [Calditrichaeota bacterium]|nr:hypothetical protein [Calditrichota bacterium]
MMKHRASLKIGLTAFFVFALAAGLNAQNKSFTLGVRGGPFAPQNWQIQGFEYVSYDTNDAPYLLTASGFGPGAEFCLYGSYNPSGRSTVLLEIGGRRHLREIALHLAPDGKKDEHRNEMTAAMIALSQVHRFPTPNTKAIPYLGLGLGAYLLRWETKQDPEGRTRTWYRGEFVLPGLHFITGFHYPLYYDLLLEGQFRYSWVVGNVKIRNEDTGTEIEYQNLNIGGVSLTLGLAYSF